MSYEEIQSNIKKIEDEIEAVKTEKKKAQDEIKEINKSLKAKDLDNETRLSLQTQIAPLQATIAALNAQLAEKEKRLGLYEQREWELANKSLQTDKNLSPNSSKKLQEAKYYKSKSDELVTPEIADLRMWTRAYFRQTYIPMGLSVKTIEFKKKIDGEQNGQCAKIHYYIENKDEYIKILYHIKTHERGLSYSNQHAGLFDPREMFVYVFFELIGLGSPERHFYYNSVFRENLYTASKDINKSLIDQRHWRTFDYDANDVNFINSFKTDDKYMKCFIYIELISKILYLNDINNNLANFGFVRPVLSYKDIRIIDFFINNEFLNVDMLSRFKDPDISYTNKAHLDEETRYLFRIKSDDKISMAKYIFSDILNCDKDFFKRNINAAIERTNSFMDNYGEGLKGGQKEEFDQNQINYQYYIEKVNLNLKKFIDDFVNSD